MVAIKLSERTQALLNDPTLGNQDIDGKIRGLLYTEYLRQLARHHRADKLFSARYGMGFDEFIERRITKELDYRWDVEQDAMTWETAIGGIQTVERKLQELSSISDDLL